MRPARQWPLCLILEVQCFHQRTPLAGVNGGRSALQSIKKQGDGQQIGAAARRGPSRHEFGMQPMQALQSGRRLPSRPRRARLGRLPCAASSAARPPRWSRQVSSRLAMMAMSASSRAQSSGTPRSRAARSVGRPTRIACGKAACASPRAPAAPNLQAGLLAVAQRAGCKPVRQPRERGRRCRNAGRIAVRKALSGRGDQQPERPDRAAVGVAAVGRRHHAPLHVATDPSELFAQPQRRRFARCRPRDGSEAVLQGLSGTPQPPQIEIVMRPVTSAVHERRLRRQLRFLNERGNCRSR